MNTPTPDEEIIRNILEQWAENTRMGNTGAILANHAPSVLIFDVLPPMKYEGTAAYKKSWDEWQPETTGPGIFDLQELHITAGQDVSFAHALIHCGDEHPDGTTFEDWVRGTFCFRKIAGKWQITHQHISMPAATGSS
ncbi:MAG: nuclear transport factor 2 family protein [Chthoniobacteraceae bacterium]